MTNSTPTLEKPKVNAPNDLASMPVDIESIVLTINDRCDACGPTAQAFVIAGKAGKVLMFCGHHGRKYEATLISQGFSIVDRRDSINKKASASSA